MSRKQKTAVFPMGNAIIHLPELRPVSGNLCAKCATDAPETEERMVKIIGGRWWYCCPRCGKKIHPLDPTASCSGVYTQCRACKWQGVMVVTPQKGA